MFNPLRRLFNASPPDRDPFDDRWFPNFFPLVKTTTGKRIGHDIALTYSGVWAASAIIADTIATLPKSLYRIERKDDRRRLHIDDEHSSHWCIGRQPNPSMTDVDFWSAQIYFLLNWGNCFAIKEYDSRGNVRHLWMIHPSRIPRENIKRNPKTGRLTYYVIAATDDKHLDEYDQDHILHIRGRFPVNGFWGQGVIPHGANSIAGGIAQDEFVNRFFENDASLGVVVTYPDALDKKKMDRMKASWAEYQKIANSHAPFIADGGPEIQRLGLPMDTSQFLENRQFSITEIARWYNVPPHMLRDLTRSSFNNIESENIHFVVISLMPWINRIEQALNTQLLSVQERRNREFKFDATALLRGDMQSRAEFYTQLFNIGVFSSNDILEREGMNPIEGEEGDLRFVQVNLQTIGSAKINEDILQKELDHDPVEEAHKMSEFMTEDSDDSSEDDDPSKSGGDPSNGNADADSQRKKGPQSDNNAPGNRNTHPRFSSQDNLPDPHSYVDNSDSFVLDSSPSSVFTLQSSSPEDAMRTLMKIKHSSLEDEYKESHSVLNGSRANVVTTISSYDTEEREAISEACQDYKTYSTKIRDYYARLISNENYGLPDDASPKVANLVKNWFVGECTHRMNQLLEVGESAPINNLEANVMELYDSWPSLSQRTEEAFNED